MKLVMAVSKDGYVARERDDDMSWTGPFDKAVFRLLTFVGGEIACGSRTARLMPKTLAARKMHVLSRRLRVEDGVVCEDLYDLKWYQSAHPDGWLIGGQRIALNALQMDLIDEAFICVSDRKCFPTDGEIYLLGTEINGHSSRWTKAIEVKVGDCRVDVWRRDR